MSKYFRTNKVNLDGDFIGLFSYVKRAHGFELVEEPYTKYKTRFGCISIYLLFRRKARILEIYI